MRVPIHCLALPGVFLMGCDPKPSGQRPPPARAVAVAGPIPTLSLDQGIAILVSQLSRDSFEADGGVMSYFRLESDAARRLVWIGKPATSRLLRALRDEEKAVAAHLVLCAIWEPPKKRPGIGNANDHGNQFPYSIIHYSGGEDGPGSRTTYACRGLRWTEGHTGVSFAEDSLRTVEEHWRKIIAASPTTEEDSREAEERWAREIKKTVPLLPRYQRNHN